jgi:hypothetical protein
MAVLVDWLAMLAAAMFMMSGKYSILPSWLFILGRLAGCAGYAGWVNWLCWLVIMNMLAGYVP